jgi:hypothetical protein
VVLFSTRTLFAILPSHIQPTCSTLLILLNLKTPIIFYEQHKSWSCTLCNFLQSLSFPILKIPQPVFSSLNVRKQDAHPYKTEGKTSIPYILIFMSHRDRSTNDSRLNGSSHPSDLICSEVLQACSFYVSVFLQMFEFWHIFRRFTCRIFVVIPPATYEHALSLLWFRLPHMNTHSVCCDSACHIWTRTQFVVILPATYEHALSLLWFRLPRMNMHSVCCDSACHVWTCTQFVVIPPATYEQALSLLWFLLPHTAHMLHPSHSP